MTEAALNLFCWHGSYIFFSESTGSLEGVRCGEGEPQNLPIAAPPKGYTTPLLVVFILSVLADAFFCVLIVFYDVVCQNKEPSTIGIIHMFNAVLVSGEEQFYNLAVFHSGSPHLCFCSSPL